MLTLNQRFVPAILEQDPQWQQLNATLEASSSLADLVIACWHIGMWVARSVLEAELQQRAQEVNLSGHCTKCGKRLESKGLVPRQLLTLVGWVRWKRRVGRCPSGCEGVRSVPFDVELQIAPYQQTSLELVRLGCLLALFVPFELAAWLLNQVSGASCTDATLWQWVQTYGQWVMDDQAEQLQGWAERQQVELEPLEPTLNALPLVIAADGVTVPFRPHPGTARGSIVWREVKVAVVARLAHHLTRTQKMVTRLLQRRLVAVLGDIAALQPRLELEACRQGAETAAQVVWISDGAKGFWRLFQESFSHLAIGILDFYHATAHLWQAADAYQEGNRRRSPQQWFARLRHQLRHGYAHRILKELRWLTGRTAHTNPATKAMLQKVHDYLHAHKDHIQYPDFKQQGLPIGSGMVESACKWLIAQRFKGVGMRWSEPGFNHLLHLRLAWVNGRFDPIFSDEPLTVSLGSPNR